MRPLEVRSLQIRGFELDPNDFYICDFYFTRILMRFFKISDCMGVLDGIYMDFDPAIMASHYPNVMSKITSST